MDKSHVNKIPERTAMDLSIRARGIRMDNEDLGPSLKLFKQLLEDFENEGENYLYWLRQLKEELIIAFCSILYSIENDRNLTKEDEDRMNCEPLPLTNTGLDPQIPFDL